MIARQRKLVGTVVILAFLGVYIWAASTLSDLVPAHWLAQLAYYILTGVAWAFPLIPLVKWMNRGR